MNIAKLSLPMKPGAKSSPNTSKSLVRPLRICFSERASADKARNLMIKVFSTRTAQVGGGDCPDR